MQSKLKRNGSKKKNFNRKQKYNNVRGNTSREISAHLPGEQADRITGTFKSVLGQTIVGNVAAAAGGIAYYMTSMYHVSSGVLGQYNYFVDTCSAYVYYRVLKSRITVDLVSLEAVNYQEIVLTPSLLSTPPSSFGNWPVVASEPYSKLISLAPKGTPGCMKRIRSTIAPVKMFTREYYEQDEYAGGVSSGDPTTMAYWILAFNNINNNTVTTGGFYAVVELQQTVEVYQLTRNLSSLIRYNPQDRTSIEDAIDRLEVQVARLRLSK